MATEEIVNEENMSEDEEEKSFPSFFSFSLCSLIFPYLGFRAPTFCSSTNSRGKRWTARCLESHTFAAIIDTLTDVRPRAFPVI